MAEFNDLFSLAGPVEDGARSHCGGGRQHGGAHGPRDGLLLVLSFTLTATDGRFALELAVPPSHVMILDALAARAATTMNGGDRH
jgi:hypothetical protein